VGYSRRKESREIADSIEESNRQIAGITLGHVCAAGVVVLNVSSHNCPRRGRYRVTRLIDCHGPGMKLIALKSVLAADCSKINSTNFFNRCGCYFPGLPK
jgi:hypothetical protein